MPKRITLNGVDFTLSADHDKNGYFGRWVCEFCGETDVSNHLDPSEERAIVAIQIGASIHSKNCPMKLEWEKRYKTDIT